MARRTLAPTLRRKIAGALGRETKGLSGRVRSFFRQYVVVGQPYQQDWNTDRAVREGFEVNPWIYRAVHVIASASIARKIVIRQGDPDKGEPVPVAADPTRLTHLFNVQANPWERAKVFRYRLIAQWLLSSRGVFVEVIRTRAGSIGLLNLLDPDMVEIVPVRERLADGREKVDPLGAFRVTVNDASGPYNELPRFDPKASFGEQPSSVLWLRSPHPTLMFRGMSPTQAAGLSADLDKAARLYNRRFMEQDGRPGGILAVKGQVRDDTLQILEARFNGGPASAGRTSAIQADAMEWVDTSNHPRDTQWSETMDRMRKEISIVFGTPESVLGDASGRTFDNADAEKANWQEDTLVPLWAMLDDQLDILTGAYDDALFFRHDLDDLWLLKRHERTDVDRAAADFAEGRITLDEWREIAGKPPFNQPWSRVVYLPGGTVPAGDPDDVAEVIKLQMLGSGVAADPSAEARAGAEEGSQLGARMAENINNSRQLRLAASGGRAVSGALDGKAVVVEAELEGKQGGARDRGGLATAGWR
ncbi:phage portal protein [Actinophytocola sp.]|uniref:phage portal protein n=1 Tax=Actinophytocola sp. TaxID=1872138 RepID=UPI002D80A4C6|nr:phage portal protein [Actinophytocola sp.]HET9144178.1 phage portal protein [Actinophytocola sp.]